MNSSPSDKSETSAPSDKISTRMPFILSARTRELRADLTGEPVRHFIDLARHGMRAGGCASTGETAAFRLLATLDRTAQLMSDIDARARAGMLTLLQALADPDAADHARQALATP